MGVILGRFFLKCDFCPSTLPPVSVIDWFAVAYAINTSIHGNLSLIVNGVYAIGQTPRTTIHLKKSFSCLSCGRL